MTYFDISDQIITVGAIDEFYTYNYNISLPNPSDGYITYFLDFTFASGSNGDIYVTTQANIAPNAYSHEDCSGIECLGCFI